MTLVRIMMLYNERSSKVKLITRLKLLLPFINVDLSELEVFVDLAAGDTDAEFTTVLKLHHAATGYAAFIFDLKETSGWESFVQVMERLALANRDSNLPSQWV